MAVRNLFCITLKIGIQYIYSANISQELRRNDGRINKDRQLVAFAAISFMVLSLPVSLFNSYFISLIL